MVLAFIITVILCVLASVLLAYGMCNAKLWENDHGIKIREPSVIADLDILTLDDENIAKNKYQMYHYEKDVVKPYFAYLQLKDSVQKTLPSDLEQIFPVSYPLIIFVIFGRALTHTFDSLSHFLAIIITLGGTTLLSALYFLLMNKCFPISTFDVEKALKGYTYTPSQDRPISEHADKNHYLFSHHHWFLFQIFEHEKRRRFFRILGYILLGTMFVWWARILPSIL